MKVSEICVRTVATVRRDENILVAARRMRESHVGALVVVADSGRADAPIGILTDRDIVVGVLAKDASHLGSLDVGDVLVNRDVVTATIDEEIGDVLRRMRSFGVRRVPVVDADGALCALLSLDDVVCGLADELAQVARVVTVQPDREVQRRP